MQLSDICVSLELAKQLKEAGYPQESVFWWQHEGVEPHIVIDTTQSYVDVCISAPTASELFEQLPIDLIMVERKEDGYHCWRPGLPGEGDAEFVEKNMADSLVRMWLYLKHQGLLSTKEEE